MNGLKLIAGSANPALAREIAGHLHTELSNVTVKRFSDGEVFVQVDESIRGADVFIIQPTCAPVNEHIMELLIILDALKRASAIRKTVVMPYYGYSRQDKKLKPREPVSAKLVADCLQVAGADRILTMDLHAEQIQAYFDLPVDHLMAGPLIADYFRKHGLVDDSTIVVSPDVGGVSSARRFAESIHSPIAIIAKRRPEPNRSEVMEIIGDVSGKRALMIDDMIDTGGSVVTGAQALLDRGAREVWTSCTHAILSGGATQKIQDSCIRGLVCTNTIALTPDRQGEKLHTISVAQLFADAIKRIHEDRSVSELFAEYA
jgi:ribose-phosphate pyrophosphokinase